MKTEVVKLATLRLDPENARRHSDRNLEAIKSSLSTYGQQKPLVIDRRGRVVAGNGTLEAARALGWEDIAVVRTRLKGAEATAYAIADNRTAELASWDDGALARALADLRAEPSLDELATGFNAAEIEKYLESLRDEPEADDAVPAPPAKPVTKPGDLWVLGDHRLLWGDATNADDVERLLAGETPFLMVTDPPYGVSYDPEWREGKDKFVGRRGKVENDYRSDWIDAYRFFPGDVAYVWLASLKVTTVANDLDSAGFDRRSLLIWRKQHFVFSQGHYHWQHEPCWYAVKKGKSARWAGDRKETTIWDVANHNCMGGKDDDADTQHGTQKPVECMARPIRNHGRRGDGVYDPFVGSGTTLVAAERLDRRCFAMDVDPRYVDVARERWESLTGKKARLEKRRPAKTKKKKRRK